MASLANILGYLEDRLPQNLPNSVREYTFLDIEIKYGLLQVSTVKEKFSSKPISEIKIFF